MIPADLQVSYNMNSPIPPHLNHRAGNVDVIGLISKIYIKFKKTMKLCLFSHFI
ncbi:hypothetical protein CLV42_10286 [Chitinophaga ginsengisoli]|uniref:Uncharacterized protein n=1 Tax=Chitinophaga ginsengisoli TaxID=363837 RepID=A0A2P8GKP2_9BACT|nr:hypothetical protein CLV42_10286 [Chitinophaga ginsengisoli]